MRKWFYLSVLLLFIFLETGCVGKREINDLALVMAVGLDKAKEENQIKVTIQVARPGDARGQTGAPSGQTGEPIWSVEAVGDSIFDAIRNISTFSSRRVFWAHNFIIVINEDLAREKGISDIIDFFTRNPELRMRTWVVSTPDNAGEIVSTVTGLEVLPGETLNKLFRYTPISAEAPRTQMMDLLSAYLSKSSEPILARVRLVEKGLSNKKPEKGPSIKQVELAGTSIFSDDKLVGILLPEETRGMLYFREELKSGVVTIPCPTKENKNIGVELRNQKFKVEPSYQDGEISFDINLVTYSAVVEAGCPFSIMNQKQVKAIEQSVEETLKTEIEETIVKVQKEYQADVLELGKYFENKYPYEWNQIEGDWEEIFPTIKIKVNVDSHVKQSSLLLEETISGKKEHIGEK